MEQFSLILCTGLAAAAFLTVCAYCGIINRRRETLRLRLPPGPRGLPIIGHMLVLGSHPHHTLAHLSQSYGPLISLRLGSVPLLVASSPDMAKLILHTHDKIFSGRPQFLSVPQITFNALDIAFSPPGPYWKLMRQLCFTEFFSTKRINYFQHMRQEEVHGLLLSIFAAQGMPISIREKLHIAISNQVSRMTLGTRVQELGSASKCMPTVLELFWMMAMFNVSDYMPWLAWMDLQGLGRRSKKAALISNAMFQEVIDRRRVGRSPDDPPWDFLDVLLTASLDSTHHVEVGDQHIRAVMMDMFAGGADTSTVTIEWAMAELLANPEELIIVKNEIEHVVGCSRLVQESDLSNLPYLQAVVNESLRLHPIVPLLLPRMSMEPCQISSYHIPKNTLVYVNTWAIHTDPHVWNNPSEFSPQRFLDINIDVLIQQCKFLPFGAGRRTCPGWKLGLLNVQYVLGSLIHAFDWKTLSKPYNMKEKYGMVVALEDPLTVVPMPNCKLPNDLFQRIMQNCN